VILIQTISPNQTHFLSTAHQQTQQDLNTKLQMLWTLPVFHADKFNNCICPQTQGPKRKLAASRSELWWLVEVRVPDRQTVRQTDGQTWDGCIMLTVMEAASLTSASQ